VGKKKMVPCIANLNIQFDRARQKQNVCNSTLGLVYETTMQTASIHASASTLSSSKFPVDFDQNPNIWLERNKNKRYFFLRKKKALRFRRK